MVQKKIIVLPHSLKDARVVILDTIKTKLSFLPMTLKRKPVPERKK